jgi:hypothetical protein
MSATKNNLIIQDTYVVTLNQANNYKSDTQLFAPFENCYYVRFLSNIKCSINTNIVKSNYQIDLSQPPNSNNITPINSGIVEIGEENNWYKTVGRYFNQITISLNYVNSTFAGFPIQIELQFISTPPPPHV